jgi:hypothetical protein
VFRRAALDPPARRARLGVAQAPVAPQVTIGAPVRQIVGVAPRWQHTEPSLSITSTAVEALAKVEPVRSLIDPAIFARHRVAIGKEAGDAGGPVHHWWRG